MPAPMSRAIVLAASLLLAQAPPTSPPPTATSPPDTEIVLAPLTSPAGGAPSVGRGVNITQSPGYDNQPSFTPDGAAIFFTSIRGGAQTDIYRYDIAARTTTQITATP